MNRNFIYQIFYDKLPGSMEDIMPIYNRCKIITCLNPYYMIKLKSDDYSIYNEFDYIASDGMGPIILNKIFGRPKSVRLSFDMVGIAGPVFQDILMNNESLYVLGDEPGVAERAIKMFQNNFVGLRVAGYHHGFINDCKEEVIQDILKSGAKVVIIGMGAPAQDIMAIQLREAGFIGTIYTCGGFLHQTQNSIDYYPNWINKLGLRWVYRLFTQKGMFKRLIESYPIFVVSYSRFLIKKQKDIG